VAALVPRFLWPCSVRVRQAQRAGYNKAQGKFAASGGDAALGSEAKNTTVP
jgi:hypothetical protein